MNYRTFQSSVVPDLTIVLDLGIFIYKNSFWIGTLFLGPWDSFGSSCSPLHLQVSAGKLSWFSHTFQQKDFFRAYFRLRLLRIFFPVSLSSGPTFRNSFLILPASGPFIAVLFWRGSHQTCVLISSPPLVMKITRLFKKSGENGVLGFIENFVFYVQGHCFSLWPVFCTLQRQNTKISKQIFPEKEYRGLSPKFHIHLSVSDLYFLTISLPLLLEEIFRPILGLYKSLTDTWM